MKRRQFVQYSSLSALSVLFLQPALAGESQEQLLLQNPDLLHFLPDAQRVKEIGDAYRSQFPEENDRHVLRSRLLESFPSDHALSEAAIKRQISAEFEEGQVVRVNGWVLSRSEARQCALYSLFTS